MVKIEFRLLSLIRFRQLGMVILAGAISGCGDQLPHLEPPAKIQKAADDQPVTVIAGDINKRNALTSSEGLTTPLGKTLAEPFSSSEPPKLTGENISINFEGIRLPAFINTVFGELLKVNFEIDSAVTKRDQLVTARTAEPIPPEQLYQLVTEVLANYGLQVVYQNNTHTYRIIEATAAKQDVPMIVRSRALSTVPGDQRPIFFFQPVHNVQSAFMQGWLELALKDRVRFSGVGNSNGLLLMGKRDDINAALETLEILDQPAMAGNHSLKITPAYWSAPKLAEQLVTVLIAEGYSAAVGTSNAAAIRLIPIEVLNTLIVFSTSEATMQHVLQWATDLDQPSQTVNAQGMYYYQVQNASADKVADLVARVLGQDQGTAGNPRPAQTQTGSQTAQNNAQTGQPRVIGKQKIMVDESRNAIIFQGTAEEYSQFLLLMKQMDRAPLEVLIEATIAEVTLSKDETLGVVLGYDNGVVAAPNRSTIKSDTGLFATLLRSNGQISANINALTTSSKISVLSTPRLVTTSGNAASIQVGSQVPIITTQQTAPTGSVAGTSNILQDVQYRNTGVLLNIKPVINSSRRVDLTISQELSSAAVNNVSSVDSPIIQQRSIQTELSLSDGETALLGGLISNNYNSGDSGVPFLQDIPILGNLFKNTSVSRDRTELIVLLTPYIIDGPETANAVRDAFRSRLGDWAQGNIDNPSSVPNPSAVPAANKKP